ncbi:aminomethyl-transferring glycine dehydrogenase [Leptospira sp. GIMC2001]|uniref:aminomethyl-transferring glycine dehydrogenase n=1 Tax=Leptospira sp. GIMC2001 TaxID=1513297 RepID=UPI00234B6990|nr:aminomethyl-transferring glycine dehydrogenase [Leptospira sp. GIMC2001]WCL49681.1 aminomethyl-transferring glycine dehydrogenase [Leptospira sp. GIMC2001]
MPQLSHPHLAETSDPLSISLQELLYRSDSFRDRHIGPSESERQEMLEYLGYSNLDDLIKDVVPSKILLNRKLNLPLPKGEKEVLRDLKEIVSKNKIFRSYIGMGYNSCVTPAVIQRNVLENPGWYTAYTPYQAEIAQGRLEALINFQTMITDLTGMDVSNASLLDEATAAAEAMTMCYQLRGDDSGNSFFVSQSVHPQTLEVLRTRANPLGIQIVVGSFKKITGSRDFFGSLVQYPSTDGTIHDYSKFVDSMHAFETKVIVAADLMALTVLKSPGEFGADAVVGCSQRFGLPLGFGGPHAGFMATRDEYKRLMPGRLIGASKDSQGNMAYRLSLQTREQHIRRDKATSNICTAQVLLAVISSFYAVYHGPQGLKKIATRIHKLTAVLAEGLERLGYTINSKPFFDTIKVDLEQLTAAEIMSYAEQRRINLRQFNQHSVGISLDETVTLQDVQDILEVFHKGKSLPFSLEELVSSIEHHLPKELIRTSDYLTHPVFNSYHTETEMLRYIKRLEAKDLSLVHSMIPLGSCTMKLNSTTEMYPVTWPELGSIHPFAPASQTEGYRKIFGQLEKWLCEITGFAEVSLQPNAGSQGEYAGLLAIRGYHQSRNEVHRDICLIPISAHGTNPASAVMAGFKVVVVSCDENGNINIDDLREKAEKHKNELGALMVTYPSTHGVFEEGIIEICKIIHDNGGQVYMDGANMNAQVAITRPGDIGADVCHLNLHKTFCIPHGGGGPGVGPIGVAEHLVPFLPGHALIDNGTGITQGAVSSAPWGSASINVISWSYIAMMGEEGLNLATKTAILNANYMAKKLNNAYGVLYKGNAGLVAHECILDTRNLKKTSGVEAEDIAKRLMDYGFHAPTMSFPVPGTLMIEPTESESKSELDRFIDSMISIRAEITEIEEGKLDKMDNPLKGAPHTASMVINDGWNRKYPRQRAAYPLPFLVTNKFWPSVGRIDNVYGDRNLICTCLPISEYGN